eukprot:TRINITY_DN19272_c2_g1_i1.p1 TRINITY_DN19272_c2_g1~~TRINITY_DN19272_c2_g1_i1.p1  ORF type:complete len:344 (-),score=69.36 TRINITY_DN19272_c2_g1_i1:163-1194(-)
MSATHSHRVSFASMPTLLPVSGNSATGSIIGFGKSSPSKKCSTSSPAKAVSMRNKLSAALSLDPEEEDATATTDEGLSSTDTGRMTGLSVLPLPGVRTRRVRLNLGSPRSGSPKQRAKSPCDEEDDEEMPKSPVEVKRFRSLTLATPSSCASHRYHLSPTTPDPSRSDFKIFRADVLAVIFDFDGTLTATPGDKALHSTKVAELRDRAAMLKPFLQELRSADLTLGIMSKSSRATIIGALEEAGLSHLFNGPVIGKAVGLEGKAGFIEELILEGELQHLGEDGLFRVLLVDDDVRELDRAKAKGIQVYSAPEQGGLQVSHLEEICDSLGLDSVFGGCNLSDFE